MVEALCGIDLDIGQGEAVGVVGESGSGKSLTALAVMRLIAPPGRITGGTVKLLGRNLVGLSEADMRSVRGREISIVFQDSAASLNPAFTIGRQLFDVITTHQALRGSAARHAAEEALALVGLPPGRLDAYPHQFSGGMRQRVLIAMAIACQPKLLIADEPTTALDVTVQLQIMQLLASLRQRLGLALMFITHNLDLMAEICDRAYVLYGGRIMETAPVEDIFLRPRHPYTRGLLACIPRLADFERPLIPIPGQPPLLGGEAIGCPFAARCPEVVPRCRAEMPALLGNGHRAACWVAQGTGSGGGRA